MIWIWRQQWQWCVDYVDIVGRSSATEHERRVGWRKQAIFWPIADVHRAHWTLSSSCNVIHGNC